MNRVLYGTVCLLLLLTTVALAWRRMLSGSTVPSSAVIRSRYVGTTLLVKASTLRRVRAPVNLLVPPTFPMRE